MNINSINPPITLSYRRFAIKLLLSSNELVSHFLEATLRGGLGYTLRGLVCTTKDKKCSKCILAQQCAYAYLFEATPPQNAPRLAKVQAVPRPFTIAISQNQNELIVELTLIGKAVDYLSYFIYTLKILGQKGIGKNRIKFQIDKIIDDDLNVLNLDEGLPNYSNTFKEIVIENGVSKNGRVLLKFSSLLVIRKNGKILTHFDGGAFFRTLLRRITNLNAFYGQNPQSEIEPHELLNACDEGVWDSKMHGESQSRFSTRQKKRIDYSGIIGDVFFSGDIGLLIPWLRAGRIFGVGKNTVFGYGRYRLLTEDKKIETTN